MFNFARRQVRPIGLEIGHDSIKMLQLSLRAPGAVLAARRAQLPPEPAGSGQFIHQALQRMLAEAPFVGRRVVAALPAGMVHIRTIRLPQIPQDFLSAAREHAANLFPFALEEATVRFIAAGVVPHGSQSLREVIAIVARKDEVRGFLAILKGAGLEVESLQINAQAAYHALDRLHDTESARAQLEIGSTSSTMVMGKGSAINFVKTIDIGGRQIDQAVAQKLGLSEPEVRQLRKRLAAGGPDGTPRSNPVASAMYDATRSLAENLAHQVAMCFRYHAITFRGQKPLRLELLGGYCADQHLQRALASAVAVPVEAADPLQDLDLSLVHPDDCEPPAGEWGVTVGLAMTAAAVAKSLHASDDGLKAERAAA